MKTKMKMGVFSLKITNPGPLSPLFQAARPSWASRRLRDLVFLLRIVSYTYAETVVCAQMGGLGEKKVTFDALAVGSLQ